MSLVVGIAVDVALLPRFAFEADEGGVSNYGVHRATVVAYSLAFGLSALFAAWAAASLHGPPRLLLRAYAVLMVAVLLLTYWYQRSRALTDLHLGVAFALVALETVGALGLTVGPARGRHSARVGAALLAVQLAGCTLAVLSSAGVLHLLFVSQVLIAGTFGLLLLRAARAGEPGRSNIGNWRSTTARTRLSVTTSSPACSATKPPHPGT